LVRFRDALYQILKFPVALGQLPSNDISAAENTNGSFKINVFAYLEFVDRHNATPNLERLT